MFGLPMLQVALPSGRTPAQPAAEAPVIPATTPYAAPPGSVIGLTGAATTEIRGVHVGFPLEVFFPLQPWAVNPFGAVCSTDGGPTRLAVASAQFRVESAASVAGTLRRFQRMQFRLFYSQNLATYPEGGLSTPGRSGPPSITGTSATSTGNRIRFATRVTGNPAAGIQEVWVTCTASPTVEADAPVANSLTATPSVPGTPNHARNGGWRAALRRSRFRMNPFPGFAPVTRRVNAEFTPNRSLLFGSDGAEPPNRRF